MSLIIAAIYKDKDVFLAADSQMTNDITNIVTHGENKIEQFNKSVGVAYAGKVSLCKQVLSAVRDDYAKREYIPLEQKSIANDIAKYTENIAPQWSKAHFGVFGSIPDFV